jgi:hypothetical protein
MRFTFLLMAHDKIHEPVELSAGASVAIAFKAEAFFTGIVLNIASKTMGLSSSSVGGVVLGVLRSTVWK